MGPISHPLAGPHPPRVARVTVEQSRLLWARLGPCPRQVGSACPRLPAHGTRTRGFDAHVHLRADHLRACSKCAPGAKTGDGVSLPKFLQKHRGNSGLGHVARGRKREPLMQMQAQTAGVEPGLTP